MKHSVKITIILVVMFLIAQLIGIFILNIYAPETVQVVNVTTGEIENKTQYNLPYGVEPPEEVDPKTSGIGIVIGLFIAVLIMFLLMRLNAETFLRLWFFVVMVMGLSFAFNALLIKIDYSALIAVLISIPLAWVKVFRRNMYVHNITELLIYPGISVIFVSLLNVWVAIGLLVFISLYDMYAVWHAGFMQKMAKYQIERVKVFSGFFIPYVGSKAKEKVRKVKKTKSKKEEKVEVSVAILGGGDVLFPMLLSGTVLYSMGIIPAILVALGATLALAGLFFMSQKGKFYPAMPFITIGCFIGLGLAYLL